MSHNKKDMSGIVMIFIMMVVGLALTPTVQELVGDVTGTYNVTAGYYNLTGPAKAIMVLVPLFWVILIIGIGLAGVVTWLRQ